MRIPAAGWRLQLIDPQPGPAAPDEVLDVVGGHRGLEGEWLFLVLLGELDHHAGRKAGWGAAAPLVLMHNQPAGNPATVLALPTIINFLRSHGYTFVNLLGDTGLGYLVLTSNGGVHNFGADWHGSVAGKLPGGVTAIGLAAAPATGGTCS
jgi:hypothetical protein